MKSITTDEQHRLVARFPYKVPVGYLWLIDHGLMGFEPNSRLQPWYLLPSEQVFSLRERWPDGPGSGQLHAFARRQDCDDLACFSLTEGTNHVVVEVVHGWTAKGYEIVSRYESIWAWLRSVITDIEDWVALASDESLNESRTTLESTLA